MDGSDSATGRTHLVPFPRFQPRSFLSSDPLFILTPDRKDLASTYLRTLLGFVFSFAFLCPFLLIPLTTQYT